MGQYAPEFYPTGWVNLGRNRWVSITGIIIIIKFGIRVMTGILFNLLHFADRIIFEALNNRIMSAIFFYGLIITAIYGEELFNNIRRN